jgi:hypothetical protein
MTIPSGLNPLLLSVNQVSIPEYISSSSTIVTTGQNIAVTTPTGTQSGDYMLALCVQAGGSTTTFTPPSGWNNVGNYGGSAPQYRVYRLNLSSAPAASYTFTKSENGSYGAVAIATFRRAAYGNINVNGTYTGGSGTGADCQSLTLTAAASLVVCVAVVGHGNDGPSAPTGFTQIVRRGTGGTDSGCGLAMHYKIFYGAGSTGNVTTGSASVTDVYAGGLRTIIYA